MKARIHLTKVVAFLALAGAVTAAGVAARQGEKKEVGQKSSTTKQELIDLENE